MPFQIVRNDITKMQVDAIVNAANPSLLDGGGVDDAIFRAAGPELLEECRALGGCEIGEAKITRAYQLPCRYVIHTVGPRWRGGLFGEKQKLASCYRSALSLAGEHGCETVAFPLISTGDRGYPKDKAIRVALDTISAFLLKNDMTVFLVLYGQESLSIGQKLFSDIQEYIDDHYVEAHPPRRNARRRERGESVGSSFLYDAEPFSRELDTAPPMAAEQSFPAEASPKEKPPGFIAQDVRETVAPREEKAAVAYASRPAPPLAAGTDADLKHLFDDLDESFQQMLLRKIDESGMSDSQCYKKANIDRKLFSKIRKDVNYKPSKITVIAFAIALELDLRETESLLRKAGFALSRSSRFDVIVQYFIERRIYDVFLINEVLFSFDQALLGA